MLHRGERILSATERRPTEREGVINIYIDNPQFRKEDDIKLLVRELDNRLKTEMRRRVSYI
jgi:pantothenate synthetase